MLRFVAGLVPFLYASLAAAEEAEQPIEGSTTGIIVFVIALIVCVAAFLWYMWKNEKKPEQEKLGDKF